MNKIDKMKKLIGIDLIEDKISYQVIEIIDCDTYNRFKIMYTIKDRQIPAFLLIPKKNDTCPAVLINHQHNGERNLGKSEVCGIAGNPLQAFGSILASKGFVVIAPDAECFEDRRKNTIGTIKNKEEDEWNHFLSLCHGVLSGQTLAKIAIEDAMGAISILNNLKCVDKNRIGCLGHSYGGNTTYFTTAFDDRIKFALSSGSVVSYKYRIENSTGIEMASVIPNFTSEFEIADIIEEIAPKKFMIVCADEDKWSKDAYDIFNEVKSRYEQNKSKNSLEIKQFVGDHSLTQERLEFIIDWIIKNSN